MSRNRLKRYGFAAATLIWRLRSVILSAGLAAGAVAGWSASGSFGLAVAAVIAAAVALTGLFLVLATAFFLKISALAAEFHYHRREIGTRLNAAESHLAEAKTLRGDLARFGAGLAAHRSEINDIRYELEARSNLSARANATLERRIAMGEATDERLVERIRDAAAGIRDLQNALASTQNLLSRREAEFGQAIEELKANAKRSGHAAEIHVAEVLAQFKKVDEKLALKANAAETRATSDEFAARFQKVDEKLASKARADRLKQLDAVAADSARNIRRIDAQLQAHHVHDRFPSKEDIEQLMNQWATFSRIGHTPASINYLAARIRSIEGLCSGRLATSSSTMIARLLAAQSVEGERLRILEIGVLFGVASACFSRICTEYGREVTLTLIDPFEGYYDRGAGDLITGVPVTRAAFERNMAAAGVKAGDYEVIQGMSDDPAVIARAAQGEYDLLLIDGDHSYDGVRKDFENFAPMVREGGVILFDDYDVNEWPDIKRFVDSAPAADPSLTLLATGFRTAAFRVKRRILRP